MSATPDSTLADSSRTIADLRRKLAECEAERDAALAREAATTEVLGVINSSPGGLAPVFDAMLERAMRLCGAAFGVFAIFDEEHYQVVATNGLPLELAEFVRQAVRIDAGSMPDHLRRGENTIQVPDITALGSELRTPGLVAMIELGKARTRFGWRCERTASRRASSASTARMYARFRTSRLRCCRILRRRR